MEDEHRGKTRRHAFTNLFLAEALTRFHDPFLSETRAEPSPTAEFVKGEAVFWCKSSVTSANTFFKSIPAERKLRQKGPQRIGSRKGRLLPCFRPLSVP